MMMILVLLLQMYTMINIVIFMLLISCCQPVVTIYSGNANHTLSVTSTNVVQKNLPHNIYNRFLHASSHSDSSNSKELKWGYKLNPKIFSGLHNTVISINKFKPPFWPLFHQANPGLMHLPDNGINNILLNDDDAINSKVPESSKNDTENGDTVMMLDGLYNFPSSGISNYHINIPTMVAQNSKNFVFRIGNWIYLGKNKNDIFVQQGYFRK